MFSCLSSFRGTDLVLGNHSQDKQQEAGGSICAFESRFRKKKKGERSVFGLITGKQGGHL